MEFNSRRSPVTCRNGCVASSNSLASQIGVDILKKGGNAADAAIAVAAALNLMEPCSTGIGGDVFVLFYDANNKKVKSINASGRAPSKLDLDLLSKQGYDVKNKFSPTSSLSVTVPGACAGWVDCFEKFGSGKLSMMDILSPVINIAKSGFPISGPITANSWKTRSDCLFDENNKHGSDLLVTDKSGNVRAPEWGEIFRNEKLAQVFESVAQHGKNGFYQGWVADSMVDVVTKMGGVLSHKDLENHKSTFESPISVEYKGYRLWETQPNSQGIVALLALSILKNFELSQYKHNSGEYLHLLIEAVRLSFQDAGKFCADPQFSEIPLETLLSDEYGRKRAELIEVNGSAMKTCAPGDPFSMRGDTVYFSTSDKDGNLCSFINSNYMGFGTGIVPNNCGFTLQNRGYNFNLEQGHNNCVEANKRPYHTIIPAMLTDNSSGDCVMSFGVMGGFMQPQGHVQVLLNMLVFGMNPQQALDAPRFLVGSGHLSAYGDVKLESGIPQESCDYLTTRGHQIQPHISGFQRSIFGRGQIIATRKFWESGNMANDGVYWAASDPRADGCAVGY